MLRSMYAIALFIVGLVVVGCGQPSSGAGTPIDTTITVTGPDGQPLKDVVLKLLATSSATQPTFFKLDGKPVEAKSVLPGKYIYYFEEIETGPQAAASRAALKKLAIDVQSPNEKNQVELKAGGVTIAAK